VYLAASSQHVSVEENPLCNRRLARVDVRHNADISKLGHVAARQEPLPLGCGVNGVERVSRQVSTDRAHLHGSMVAYAHVLPQASSPFSENELNKVLSLSRASTGCESNGTTPQTHRIHTQQAEARFGCARHGHTRDDIALLPSATADIAEYDPALVPQVCTEHHTRRHVSRQTMRCLDTCQADHGLPGIVRAARSAPARTTLSIAAQRSFFHLRRHFFLFERFLVPGNDRVFAKKCFPDFSAR